MGLLAAVAVPAQDKPNLDRRTLKGIKGVLVYAGVAKDIEETGLRTNVVKADTELKLRQAGIRVLEDRGRIQINTGIAHVGRRCRGSIPVLGQFQKVRFALLGPEASIKSAI